MGCRRTFLRSLFSTFVDLKRWISGRKGSLSKKLELNLQNNNCIDLDAVLHEKLTNEDLMEFEAQRKKEENQEEEDKVTDEPKIFLVKKMARGFSLFEEALAVFEAQDPNVERYAKVPAAALNVIQCYRVPYDEGLWWPSG